MIKNTVQRSGWIIKNTKKNSIWKQPFLTKEEAMSELRSQISMRQKVHPSFRGEEYKIEPFEYYGNETEPADDFKDFAG